MILGSGDSRMSPRGLLEERRLSSLSSLSSLNSLRSLSELSRDFVGRKLMHYDFDWNGRVVCHDAWSGNLAVARTKGTVIVIGKGMGNEMNPGRGMEVEKVIVVVNVEMMENLEESGGSGYR